MGNLFSSVYASLRRCSFISNLEQPKRFRSVSIYAFHAYSDYRCSVRLQTISFVGSGVKLNITKAQSAKDPRVYTDDPSLVPSVAQPLELAPDNLFVLENTPDFVALRKVRPSACSFCLLQCCCMQVCVRPMPVFATLF